MKNFWNTIQKPAMVIAPMADVTDVAFRRMFARYGKPDVMWTEFVSCDGLYHTREKQGMKDTENPLMYDLLYDEGERPIVAQLFTGDPKMMEYGARLAQELGFDGVDINMGCPQRNINHQGAGAELIKTPSLAQEIVYAAKQGAPNIPVSVKTRTGYNVHEIETWIPALLGTKPAVLTLHARTKKQMSKVPAQWEHVARTVQIRDERGSDAFIFGNGDVNSLDEAHTRGKETNCDGVMIGRGIFGNPWFFNPNQSPSRLDLDGRKEILHVLLEHTRLFEELLPHKNFSIMKKHYKAYITGWDGAKELRIKLMEAKNGDDVAQIIELLIS